MMYAFVNDQPGLLFGGGGEEPRPEGLLCHHIIGNLLGHFLWESYADHMTTSGKILWPFNLF